MSNNQDITSDISDNDECYESSEVDIDELEVSLENNDEEDESYERETKREQRKKIRKE